MCWWCRPIWVAAAFVVAKKDRAEVLERAWALEKEKLSGDAGTLWRWAPFSGQRQQQWTSSSVADRFVIVQCWETGLCWLSEADLRALSAARAGPLLARGLSEMLVLRLPSRWGWIHALHQGQLAALSARLFAVRTTTRCFIKRTSFCFFS